MAKKQDNCPYCGEGLQEYAESVYNDGVFDAMDTECPYCNGEIYIIAAKMPEFTIEKT